MGGRPQGMSTESPWGAASRRYGAPMSSFVYRARRVIGHLWWRLHLVAESPLYLVPRSCRDVWWFDRVFFPALVGVSGFCVDRALRWWGRRDH